MSNKNISYLLSITILVNLSFSNFIFSKPKSRPIVSNKSKKPSSNKKNISKQNTVSEVEDKSSFNTMLSDPSRQTAIVKVYAPWCGFCKKITEPFNKLATKFKDINFHKLDATKTDLKDVASKYGANGFPTFLAFEPGQSKPKTTVVGADLPKLTRELTSLSKYKPSINERVSELETQFINIETRCTYIERMLAQVAQKVQGLVSTLENKSSNPAPSKKGKSNKKSQEDTSKGSSVIDITSMDHLNGILGKNKPVVAEVHGEAWCGPCKMMKAPFSDLAKKHKGKATFVKIDVDKHKDIAQKHNAMSLPTFLLFKSKEKDASDKVVGANKDELNTKVEKLVK